METARSRRWSLPRPRGYLRATLIAVSAILILVSGVGLAAHWQTPHNHILVAVTAFAPYLLAAAGPAVLLLAISRAWIGVALGLAVIAVSLPTQVPLFVAASPGPSARSLVVLTSNLRVGNASPSSIVATVRKHQVDVLMLEELTPGEQQNLLNAGLGQLLPYSVSDARASAFGTGLWSRYPLADPTRRTDFLFAFVTARIVVPGIAQALQVAALHMPGPWPSSTDWLRDMAHLATVLPTLYAGRPVIVGGDFNATPDVAQFRTLQREGFRDAADQAGAGYLRTFPANRWFPPLIEIDHVLTRDAQGRSAKTVEIPGSDHRALLVTVAVPAA